MKQRTDMHTTKTNKDQTTNEAVGLGLEDGNQLCLLFDKK